MASRDPWFDNAKMALVTLVVVGHAWTLLPLTGTVGPIGPTRGKAGDAFCERA